MEQQEYAQRGYLREDFRLFHLKGAMEEQLDWHYHTCLLYTSQPLRQRLQGKPRPHLFRRENNYTRNKIRYIHEYKAAQRYKKNSGPLVPEEQEEWQYNPD